MPRGHLADYHDHGPHHVARKWNRDTAVARMIAKGAVKVEVAIMIAVVVAKVRNAAPG